MIGTLNIYLVCSCMLVQDEARTQMHPLAWWLWVMSVTVCVSMTLLISVCTQSSHAAHVTALSYHRHTVDVVRILFKSVFALGTVCDDARSRAKLSSSIQSNGTCWDSTKAQLNNKVLFNNFFILLQLLNLINIIFVPLFHVTYNELNIDRYSFMMMSFRSFQFCDSNNCLQ